MDNYEIVLLVISVAVTIYVIMIHFSFKISPESYDYMDIRTGGALDKKYLGFGPYESSRLSINRDNDEDAFTIYFPEALFKGEERFPVIIYSNGTLVRGTDFPLVMKRLSSWGFIVMATEDEFSHSGLSYVMCLELILKLNNSKEIAGISHNPFYGMVDIDNIGAHGHSQGGVAVFNAFNNYSYGKNIKAIFAASPVSMRLSRKLIWDYNPSIITVPTFLVSCIGRGDEFLVVDERELEEIYNLLPDSIFKVMARRVDADHGEMLNRADGYMTAWFRWILRGDVEASKVFTGGSPEIKNNPLYIDVKVND